jgi:hypothetical protein
MADKLAVAYRRAVLLIALSKFGAKEANTDLLKPGSSTPISAFVEGQVGRAAASCSVKGLLNVGHPSTVNSSSAAPPADVLAAVLGEIPADRRAKLLDSLKKSYNASGGELPVDESLRKEATAWLAALKMSRPSTRSGSVSFQVLPG